MSKAATKKLELVDVTESFTADEKKELRQLEKLPDAEILLRAGNLGPGILGRPLHYIASRVKKNNPDGSLGAAILDPDHDAKSLAKQGKKRLANGQIVPIDADVEDESERRIPKTPKTTPPAAPPAGSGAGTQGTQTPPAFDPADITHKDNPWTYVTLSGAKQLAMTAGISHKSRVTRAELIAELQKAAVVPPPVPTDADEDDDDEIEGQ